MSDDTPIQHSNRRNSGRQSAEMACLVVIKGDILGEVYQLDRESVTIGRAADADLVLSDSGACGQYTQISKQGQNWIARDLSGTHGTLLNKEKLDAPTELLDGDKIRILDTIFKFSYHDDDDTEFHRQLRERTMKDGLTQVYNRRYFMEVIAKEFNYAERHGTSLGLAAIDIDHFKQINDTYGNPAGDYILKNLCLLIAAEAREYDTFSRIGGEEFALLLRDSSVDSTATLAERIRAKIESTEFEFEGNRFEVTISIGIATFTPGKSFEEVQQLIDAADQQLYKAKRNGRNQVCYLH